MRLIVDGQMSAIDPAGVVPGIRSGGEAGLLGVAVDPGFPARPYVYVQGTHLGALPGTNTVRIWRYTLTGSAIDTTQFVPPVHEYPHVGAGWAVFAGPLYHAPAGRLVRL